MITKLTQKIGFLVVLLSLAWSMQAQDIHFSQFYLSPLNLNPALTGVMNCNGRVSGNYRNQWGSILRNKAFSTFSVSYDQKIPVGRSDYFGAGITLWRDQAGSLNFGTMQARLSGSYSKKMGGYRKKAHYFVVGAEAGYSQRSVDFQKAQWGNQYNGNASFDPNLPSYENWGRNQFGFLDAGAGILWFSVFDEMSNFHIGGSYHHINRANVSFSGGDAVPLYSRISGHVGGEFMLSDRIGMGPKVVAFFQGPSMEINGGTNLKFVLGDNKFFYQAVQFGAWVRIANKLYNEKLMDALILSTRFDYDQFSLGFSYDVNTSQLRQASNSNGAFEFSLAYKICGPERRGVYCPHF
ncbi:MAG TPA: type IX secretion system membrane protein PorP/SprF [Saprospiraceae bacterium]|nr:type IX secretion system membrane protein PorP/SprF [Saprospiraceae bacterium]